MCEEECANSSVRVTLHRIQVDVSRVVMMLFVRYFSVWPTVKIREVTFEIQIVILSSDAQDNDAQTTMQCSPIVSADGSDVL